MPDFVVTSYEITGTTAVVLAAMVVKINTIDNAKVLRLCQIEMLGRDRDSCKGMIIYDA